MASLIGQLMGPPFFAMIGAALILFAGWALFRLATGHAPPGTSRRDMIIAVMVVIGLAVFGVGALLAALPPRAPDTPGVLKTRVAAADSEGRQSTLWRNPDVGWRGSVVPSSLRRST